MKEPPKSLSAKMYEYYVKQRMARLLNKTYTRMIDNGKQIKVTFTQRGNKHLLSDTYRAGSPLQRIDLPNIDKIFEDSDYVQSSNLFKPRKDNITTFHYFKVKKGLHGSTAYINVAEQRIAPGPESGRTETRATYFVYSITRRLYKNKKPRN